MRSNEDIIKEINKIYLTLASINFSSSRDSSGLLTDLGGRCLFFFYYGKQLNNEVASNKALDLVDDIVNRILASAHNKQYSLCTGVSGLLWLLKHLEENDFIDFEDGSIFSELDMILFNYVDEELSKGNYDYLHGSMGIFNYLLMDTTNSTRRSSLNKVVDMICSVGNNHEGRIYWQYFNSLTLEVEPNIINMGIAHGELSIVFLLSKFYKTYPNDHLKKIIESSVMLILEYQNKSINVPSLYPYTVNLDKPADEYSRLGWCYGDLGVASTLWYVGVALNRNDFKEKAIIIMKSAASRRNIIDDKVRDAALCHGSAGIAYMFKIFYNETGEHDFLSAFEFWLDHTLDLLNQNPNCSTGMCSWSQQSGYYESFGLLEGISGVGLVLLSCLPNNSKTWDQVFLLS